MKAVVFFAVMALFLGQVFAQVNLTSSLTACYALDGNAVEPISGLTGTLAGCTPTVNRFNAANSALHFSGQVQFVELPDNPLLKPANAMSFSCWLRGTLLTDAYVLFTENSMGSFFEAYELCIDPTLTFMSRKAGPSGINQVNSTTQFATNTWFHVVITIDNSFVKIYVNGQLEDTTPSTFAGFDYVPGKKVVIGATNSWYDKPFQGTIDNVRFYNRTINAAEVLALYNTDPPCSTAGPIANISVPSPICVGTTVQFTDASTNNPTQWTWSMPGSAMPSSTQQNPQTIYSSAGVYTVTLLASSGAGTSTTSTTVTVLPAPIISAAASKSLICRGSFVTVTASGATSYTWQPINAVTAATVVSLLSNSTLTVIGTGTNACKGVAYLPIQVQICESIDDVQSQLGFDVIYNASKKELSLYNAGAPKAMVSIYSYDLKLLKQIRAGENVDATVSTEDLPLGIYILVIETDRGKATKKLFLY